MPEEKDMRRAVYKAVRNYIANELGLDRNEIRKILDERIAARNPEQLIKESVERYFHTGHDAFQAGDAVKRQVTKTVDEYVAKEMQSGARPYLDSLIQERVDEITGRLGNKAPALPGVPGRRANATYFAGAALVDRTLAKYAFAQWIERTFDTSGDRKIAFRINENPNPYCSWSVTLDGLRPSDQAGLDTLRPYCTDTQLMFHHLSGAGQSVTLPTAACEKILSNELGWFEIDRTYPCPDGLLVLPGKS